MMNQLFPKTDVFDIVHKTTYSTCWMNIYEVQCLEERVCV